MIGSRRSGWGALAFVAVCCLFSLTSLYSGQGTGPNLTGSSNCAASDFDLSVQFRNGPADYYGIVLNQRNLSSHPCVLDGPVYGPSFVPDRVSGQPPFKECYECELRMPNRRLPQDPPLILKPGQTAQHMFRWKTTPAEGVGMCLQPQWVGVQVLLVAPSLLKQVCADYEVSQFSLVTSPGSDGQSLNAPQGVTFDLAASKSTYDLGEPFSLRLALAQPSPEPPSKAEGCPTLYLKQRSPDGDTRIDEVKPLAFKGCPHVVLGHQPGDWWSGFDLDSGANSKWQGVGEHTFEVFQLVGPRDDSQLRFVSSNVLRIQVVNPESIPRQWGERVKGIAVDITLDKDVYQIGEDVLLHLAVENFGAEVPIYGWDPVWDPCMEVGIEVRDASGRPLPINERFPNWSICTGHGFGPRKLYAKGKVVPLERTLGREGWLPNHPGAYTVVITWSPCTGLIHDEPNGHFSWAMKPYAVVHATANIRIATSDGSDSN